MRPPAYECEGVDPMGRGRAKAKQTKVARELKYRTFDTDFSSLRNELRGDDHSGEVPDAYADLASEYDGKDSSKEESTDGYQDLRKSG